MRSAAYYPSDYFAEITRRELNPYTGRDNSLEPVRISDAERAYDKYYVMPFCYYYADGMEIRYRVKYKGEAVVEFTDKADADRLAQSFNNLRRAV